MKVAVLLSGGVDSSLALYLLKEQGYDVTAFYLKIWLEDDAAFLGECPWEEDLSYARAICEKLSVPLEIVPLQREYYDRVVSYTINELQNGRTPSPDLFCNQRIKFGAFFDKISSDYEKVASGHYARLEHKDGRSHLKLAPDPVKDQTYFLCQMSEEQFSRLLFPIGEYTKKEVRELAEKYDIPAKARKDSQGICFLGKIKFRDFARNYLGEKKGDIIVLESGEKKGTHEGYWFYTIGQRSGLGLSGGPWYVVKKDIEKNIIYISHSYDAQTQERDSMKVGEFNWINDVPVKQALKCKLRHGPHMYSCDLQFSEDQSSAIVTLGDKDRGIAPGQFAVFYDGEVCLGCGTILD